MSDNLIEPPGTAISYLQRYLEELGVSAQCIRSVLETSRSCRTAFWCDDQGLFPGIYIHDLDDSQVCRQCHQEAAQALAGGWFVCPGNSDHAEAFRCEQDRRSRLSVEAAVRSQIRRHVLPHGYRLALPGRGNCVMEIAHEP